MGAKCTRTEFEYTYSDEPHATRRKQILGKYSNFITILPWGGGGGVRFKWTTLKFCIKWTAKIINKCKMTKCADNLVLVDGPVVIVWSALSRFRCDRSKSSPTCR